MLKRIVPVALLVLGTIGCTGVAPYDRGRLAHPSMTVSDLAQPSESHVRAVQEGATGGGLTVASAVRMVHGRRRVSSVGAALVTFVCCVAQAQSNDAVTEPGGHPRAELHLGRPGEATKRATGGGRGNLEIAASTEVAGYADTDHVFVITPTVSGTLSNEVSGWSVSGRYLVDVVSAASADVVSTASPPFLEVRHAGTLEGSYKPHSFGVKANADVSFEPDYTSVMGGATATQDLFAKNLTLLLGYSHLHDIAGRSGTPYSVFSRTLDRDAIKGGATVLVSRSTLVSFVVDVMFEYGDPSKPYRYVPMFAPGTPVSRGASVDEVTRLRLPDRVLEQLPLTRDRYAMSMGWAHRFRTSTLRLDERAYVDTWGLKATATDARWLFDFARRIEVGPHLRFYGQTPVDFWQRAYVAGPGYVYPALRTGNRELGPLINLTGGASLRAGLGTGAEPRKWLLGFDVNVTSTQYLDDLYLTQRWSGVGSLSLEVAL
jgi:hypothetical protein